FASGEVGPAAAFVDREDELARLTGDLLAGQKVFLISPRRYGKSSLVRQALGTAARRGALTVEVTVSSYSSYVAFLEGYARALVSSETRLDRARTWLRDLLANVRHEVHVEPQPAPLGLPCPSPRSEPIATSHTSPNRSSRCRAGSPARGAGGWQSRSTSFRRSASSTAAASSTRSGPLSSNSATWGMCSPAPN